MVGAPKDNSSYSLTKIHEFGAVYKCILASQKCSRYDFDKMGDEQVNVTNISKKKKTATFHTSKDYQMFGMTMDGGGSENSPFVTCAPRFIQHFENINHCLHGMCAWVNETDSENPKDVIKLIPFRKFDSHLNIKGTGLGQAGFSVAITEDKDKEVVLGAPTAYEYAGKVFFIFNFFPGRIFDLFHLFRNCISI